MPIPRAATPRQHIEALLLAGVTPAEALTEAAHQFPGRELPHASTVRRWRDKLADRIIDPVPALAAAAHSNLMRAFNARGRLLGHQVGRLDQLPPARSVPADVSQAILQTAPGAEMAIAARAADQDQAAAADMVVDAGAIADWARTGEGPEPAGLHAAQPDHARAIRAAVEAEAKLGRTLDHLRAARIARAWPALFTATKGEWARQPLALDGWQLTWIARLLCTLRRDGTRHYDETLLAVPKKNGKTELAASLVLWLWLETRTEAPEALVIAAVKEQASLAYGAMKQMVNQSPALRATLNPRSDAIHAEAEDATGQIRVISAESIGKQGPSPSVVLVDEEHEIVTEDARRAVEAVTSTHARAARRNSLVIVTTTAGVEGDTICRDRWRRAETLLETPDREARMLPIIYAAPPEHHARWDDVAVAIACNPSYGVTFGLDELQDQLREAQRSPLDRLDYLRFRLNIWTPAGLNSWMDMEAWDACAAPEGPEALRLTGGRVFGGLDLGLEHDLAAWSELTVGDEAIALSVTAWIPEQSIQRRNATDRRRYDRWLEGKWLRTTPGAATDFKTIRRHIVRRVKALGILAVGFDHWQATEMAQALEDEGIELHDVRQSPTVLNSPTRSLYRAAVNGRLIHDGSPVMRAAVAAVALRLDGAGNCAPCKRTSTSRIDPVTASVCALDAAERSEPDLPLMLDDVRDGRVDPLNAADF